jgi:Phosphotransferase enzyme family
MASYVKRRGVPSPGSIPAVLDIFRAEVRFYREIAPVVGVRVPACYESEDTAAGTLLVLEDLSGWQPGADPVAAAAVLAGMHRHWAGQAHLRWPWLRPVGAGADLVQELYGRVWPDLAAREDLPARVRRFGERLVGHVARSERAVSLAGPITLVHGDASTANLRTGPAAEIALLDWEDVSAAPGVVDLAWLLVSSVAPARWDEVIGSYGTAAGLADVFPAASVQGMLSMHDTAGGSAEALAWAARLDAAAGRLA